MSYIITAVVAFTLGYLVHRHQDVLLPYAQRVYAWAKSKISS